MPNFDKQSERRKEIVTMYLERPELSQVQIGKMLKLPRSTVRKVIRTYV